MAGKKTKKKSASKPAAKKKTKKAPAKQAKKAAAKKAAPKTKPPAKKPAKKPAKQAAKKSAARKPAPARKPPKAPKEAPEATAERIEVVEGTDAPVEAKPSLQAEILAMARQLYGDRSDDELLALDPNDIDAMDPSIFYDLLGEKYGVTADPDNDYFGGFGGPIKKLIEFVEARWDGQTRNDTPMPPGEWLQEFVHPESSTDS